MARRRGGVLKMKVRSSSLSQARESAMAATLAFMLRIIGLRASALNFIFFLVMSEGGAAHEQLAPLLCSAAVSGRMLTRLAGRLRATGKGIKPAASKAGARRRIQFCRLSLLTAPSIPPPVEPSTEPSTEQ